MFDDNCFTCRFREQTQRKKGLVAYAHKRVKAVVKALPKEEWLVCRAAVVNEIHAWLIISEMDAYQAFLTTKKGKDLNFNEVRDSIHSLVVALFEIEAAILWHLY